MADILTFKPRDDTYSADQFCDREDETLQFHKTPKGTIEFHRRKSLGHKNTDTSFSNDWDNQELADLFRVKNILETAGLAIEIDRGVSDEGDPWFIFCHETGEVFIHFCRIDGFYILDNPNLYHPLKGRDFNGLVTDFTQNAFTQDISETHSEDHAHVIRFDRAGKLRLHPSTVLAALVWTLFLASEDIVLPAQRHKNADTDEDSSLSSSNDMLIAFSDTGEHVPPEPSHLLLPFASQEEDATDLVQDNRAASEHPNSPALKDVIAQSGLATAPNTYGIALSSIAFALGLMSAHDLVEIDHTLLEDTQSALATIKEALEKVSTSSSLILTDAIGIENAGLGIDGLLNHDVMAGQESASVTMPLLMGQAPEAESFSALKTDNIKNGAFSSKIILKIPEEPSERSDPSTPLLQDLPDPHPNEAAKANVTDAAAISAEEFEVLLHSWNMHLQSYTLQKDIVYASFDLVDLTNIDLTSQGSVDPSSETGAIFSDGSSKDAFTPQPLYVSDLSIKTLIETALLQADDDTQKQVFDKDAAAFIHFMLDRFDNLEVIRTDNDFVFLDLETALNDVPADLHLMSWSLDNGGVVTTIGLLNDFESFHLTA